MGQPVNWVKANTMATPSARRRARRCVVSFEGARSDIKSALDQYRNDNKLTKRIHSQAREFQNQCSPV